MSSVYATEPATSGRVLFETTYGPLEIQLWCRECPQTTKFFLQLCLDDFYIGMLFHRIVPNLFLQTGAIRQGTANTASVGMDTEIIPHSYPFSQDYLERRKHELHSRIKFNHRGQVAMALNSTGTDDLSLQPQFFITLDEAPYLNGTHVVFGTIVGPTLFNAIRMGKIECDEQTHTPIDMEYAPRITRVKIIDHPWLDLLTPTATATATATVPWKSIVNTTLEPKQKKSKRKGKKDFNVLSFGNELEQDEGWSTRADTGTQSSHDVARTSKARIKEVHKTMEHAIKNTSETKTNQATRNDNEQFIRSEPIVRPSIEMTPVREIPSPSPPRPTPTRHSPKKSSSVVEARLAKYKHANSSNNKRTRQDDTMAKLLAFQTKVQQNVQLKKNKTTKTASDGLASRMMANNTSTNYETSTISKNNEDSYHGQVLETDDDPKEWLGSKFICKRHVDHASREGLGGDGRSIDEYLVVDPKKPDDVPGRQQRRRERH